jgi:hypothetical protein
MGQSAEKMAKENGISRTWQDEIALTSHRRAAAAWKAGVFDGQVMYVPVPPAYTITGAMDDIVRPDTSLEALSKLKPVFDRAHGSVTAGNSSPLTDGAAALLVMREDRARALGLQPLGALRAFAYAATDPADQLLQGPAYAAPVALDRAGMRLADIDLAVQGAPVGGQQPQAFGSPEFAARLPAARRADQASTSTVHRLGPLAPPAVVMQALDRSPAAARAPPSAMRTAGGRGHRPERIDGCLPLGDVAMSRSTFDAQAGEHARPPSAPVRAELGASTGRG